MLRVEDTDAARNTPEAVQIIYDGLRWLGLEWDEGPYFQSEREALYERHFETLRAAGRIYEDAGAWRFRFERKSVAVEDLVCGRVEVDMSNPETNPDMTIRRPDGGWIFHFVNVVDDLEMKITHVIRGEDHLSNTPKHLQLYEALGAAPPRFAHIPLILNRDGSKMSKRDQGASIATYIDEGYLPEAVRNYLCLLGWSPKDNREKIAINDVIELFDLEKINRKNAAFDLDKLLWLNGEYMRELDDERFNRFAATALWNAGLRVDQFDPDYVRAALETCKGKIKRFTELPQYAGFYFRDDFPHDPAGVEKAFTPENTPRLQKLRDVFAALESFDPQTLEMSLKETAKELGVKAGVLVHPARLACTGNTAGPSLYHLLAVLGKERVLTRFDRALGLSSRA